MDVDLKMVEITSIIIIGSSSSSEDENNTTMDIDESPYGCYLLLSLHEKQTCKKLLQRRTYIGCTNDFEKRLSEHNGNKAGGAKHTASARPWTTICRVTGFACRKDVLQFEWAWQHPSRSCSLKPVRVERARTGKDKLPPHGSNVKFALSGLKAMRIIHPDLTVDWHSAEMFEIYNNLK